jgi:hypothetical protein
VQWVWCRERVLLDHVGDLTLYYDGEYRKKDANSECAALITGRIVLTRLQIPIGMDASRSGH